MDLIKEIEKHNEEAKKIVENINMKTICFQHLINIKKEVLKHLNMSKKIINKVLNRIKESGGEISLTPSGGESSLTPSGGESSLTPGREDITSTTAVKVKSKLTTNGKIPLITKDQFELKCKKII